MFDKGRGKLHHDRERECLAVVWATRHFAVYLQGTEFKLVTDHCPLTYLRGCKDPRGRLARWILELEQFTYTMEHRSGSLIPHADALSRAPTQSESVDPCSDTLVPELDGSHEVSSSRVAEILLSLDEGELLKGQRRDPDLLLVIACMAHDIPCPADASPSVRFYLERRSSLWVDSLSGLLYWTADDRKQLVVPTSSVKGVLEAVHDSQFSGHLGMAKTLQKLRDRFFWRTMYEDTVSHLRSCISCNQRKNPPKPLRANFGKMPVPSAPWHWISLDIAGPFPVTEHGNRYILVVTCAFSKWVETFPLPNQEASTIASILVNQLFSRYGCPLVIHSDQGRNFESNLIREVCRHLGIEKSRTSSYHPQGNGLVERFNGTVCAMLSMFVADDQRDWDTYLAKVTFAYNTSVHESTKETPFSLFLGRQPRLPADVSCGVQGCPAASLLSEERKQDIYGKVNEAIRRAAARRAERQATRSHQITYQVGDFVWLHNPARKIGRSPKLCRPWEGPYRVISALSSCTYRIQLRRKGRRRTVVVHHDRLKPCVCREDEAYNSVMDATSGSHDVLPRRLVAAESSGVDFRSSQPDGTTSWGSPPGRTRTHDSECSCEDISHDIGNHVIVSDDHSAPLVPAHQEPASPTVLPGHSAPSPAPAPVEPVALDVPALALPVPRVPVPVEPDDACPTVPSGPSAPSPMPTPMEPVTRDVPDLSYVDPPATAPVGSDETLADPVPSGLASTLRRSERSRRKPNMYGEWDLG